MESVVIGHEFKEKMHVHLENVLTKAAVSPEDDEIAVCRSEGVTPAARGRGAESEVRQVRPDQIFKVQLRPVPSSQFTSASGSLDHKSMLPPRAPK